MPLPDFLLSVTKAKNSGVIIFLLYSSLFKLDVDAKKTYVVNTYIIKNSPRKSLKPLPVKDSLPLSSHYSSGPNESTYKLG